MTLLSIRIIAAVVVALTVSMTRISTAMVATVVPSIISCSPVVLLSPTFSVVMFVRVMQAAPLHRSVAIVRLLS